MESPGFFKGVWAIVARIPEGKVATYGQIAAMLGKPRAARTVGWALNSLPRGKQIPWHRVINSEGKISRRDRETEAALQQRLLKVEGIQFDNQGRVNLNHYQWQPDTDILVKGSFFTF